MKKFIFAMACALALASCSGGGSATEQTESQQAPAEAVEAETVGAYAPDGTVHELDDASYYVPGVHVPNLTVLDFNAVWCGPCRQLTPVIERLAETYNGRVTFVTVDIDNYGELFQSYNVGESIPAVVVIRPDGQTEAYIGTGDLLPESKFTAILDRNLQ